ncbi:MAG: branched-chain amino acid transporter permease [Anaerosporomusa subterranea]|jgi:branched-chain amino acid transport system permease protein|nr:branched-chain amino acid transporter permease [Anaerosporomusa subterranea]
MKNMTVSSKLLSLLVAALFLFPLVYDDAYLMSVLVLACIYTVYVAAWDLLSGFTGQENFGFALFIGTGAYLVGFITKFGGGIAPLWGILLGGLAAASIGLALGIPCLRLKGPYLALATLAAAAIADRLAIIFSKYTGGEDGIYGVEFLTGDPLTDYYAALVFMVVSVSILYMIGRSHIGLLLKAIREDETAAEAGGVNTTLYKVAAFVVSAWFGGMAGAFNAHYLGYVGPDAVLASHISLNIIIMAVVGGAGSIINAALGAFVLAVAADYLKHFGEYHLLIYTSLLILVLLFMPKGIFSTLGARLTTGSAVKGGGVHEHLGG